MDLPKLEYLPPRLPIPKCQEGKICSPPAKDTSGRVNARTDGSNVQGGFEHGTISLIRGWYCITHQALLQPLMLAVKRGDIMTTRAILNFGIDPAIVLLKDADGSTLLHVAAQSTNDALAEILAHRGPAELLYSENSVGQTPLDIAGLKNLPRSTGTLEARQPNGLHSTQLPSLQCTAPFDVEKLKVEIPKLRATLDILFAGGHLLHGTKLATELLTFADHMGGKLLIEVARKSAAGKDAEEAEVDPAVPQGNAAQTYAVLRDAAAARPGPRQLVHLADVQRSVQRNLAQQAEASFVSWSQHLHESNESTEVDPAELHIAQLKARSLFEVARSGQILFGYNNRLDLFGEDKV